MIKNIFSILGLSTLLPATLHSSEAETIDSPAALQLDPWSDTSRQTIQNSTDSTLQELISAMHTKAQVAFYYFGGSTPRRLRKVSVDSVFRTDQSSHTYIRAYCHLRGDFRIFRADKLALA